MDSVLRNSARPVPFTVPWTVIWAAGLPRLSRPAELAACLSPFAAYGLQLFGGFRRPGSGLFFVMAVGFAVGPCSPASRADAIPRACPVSIVEILFTRDELEKPLF
jgi:hypothetical protein